jgi:transposase
MGRHISKEFKQEAVRLVLEQGLGVKEAATELGISLSALGNWVRKHQAQGGQALSVEGNLSAEQQKIRELEKKLKIAEMERDILKKATAFFAKGSL